MADSLLFEKAEDINNTLGQEKHNEDVYQYDNVSVASSLWSLEAQASVKNMRVSQNNLPSNNGIDENDGGIDESKQNSNNDITHHQSQQAITMNLVLPAIRLAINQV